MKNTIYEAPYHVIFSILCMATRNRRYISIHQLPVLWLEWLLLGLLPDRSKFCPRQIHVTFEVDEMGRSQVSLPVFRSSLISIIPQTLHPQLILVPSWWRGTASDVTVQRTQGYVDVVLVFRGLDCVWNGGFFGLNLAAIASKTLQISYLGVAANSPQEVLSKLASTSWLH